MEKRFYTRSYDDQYITIYNPSKQTLYLDSMAIVTNQIDPTCYLRVCSWRQLYQLLLWCKQHHVLPW